MGLNWRIGNVEVFQIVEVEAGEIIQGVIEEATPERIRSMDWLIPRFADQEGNLKALVQAFLIKSGDKNILIDTCNGNDKKRTDVPEWASLKTGFLGSLTALGVSEQEIDIVACTHLHMDHVGWNTKNEEGKWVPTFPNAKYLFAREEYEYWKGQPEKEIADDHAAFEDSVVPIVEAGLAEFVEPDHRIDSQVRFIPTPGHTPCHVSVLIESRGQRAIISGDFLHHPCQIEHPEWPAQADTFPQKARETRKALLGRIADEKILLIGSHFANPVAGRVRKCEERFEFR